MLAQFIFSLLSLLKSSLSAALECKLSELKLQSHLMDFENVKSTENC